jgi:SAM-dependent methyltransferase
VTEADRAAASYDVVAGRYAQEFGDELATKPIDRALYACFAELVGAGARVGDVGCGPGHVARHLADLGLDPVGVDPSPGMISAATRRHPELAFRVGSLADLGEPASAWSGAVVPYSLIHITPEDRPGAYAELARVIRPGGWLLVAFHVSMDDQPPGSVRHLDDLWGQTVDLDFHFIDPPDVEAGLGAVGFSTVARTEREPWPEVEAQSRRCYVLARRH